MYASSRSIDERSTPTEHEEPRSKRTACNNGQQHFACFVAFCTALDVYGLTANSTVCESLTACKLAMPRRHVGIAHNSTTSTIRYSSEARRVGKECVGKGRSRWSPFHVDTIKYHKSN